MSESRDGITLPPWTKLIPKENPGWYWVMRKGMWPKCIRTIYSDKGIKPAEPRDGSDMKEYTHFIGPVAEPNPLSTKNIFADEQLFFQRGSKKRGKKDDVHPAA